jgi:hypothetical protein
MGGRRGFQREFLAYIQRRWGWSMVHHIGNDWPSLAVLWGGIVR